MSLGESEGAVGGYVHGAMGPGVGKNAALVALKLGEWDGRRERPEPTKAASSVLIFC